MRTEAMYSAARSMRRSSGESESGGSLPKTTPGCAATTSCGEADHQSLLRRSVSKRAMAGVTSTKTSSMLAFSTGQPSRATKSSMALTIALLASRYGRRLTLPSTMSTSSRRMSGHSCCASRASARAAMPALRAAYETASRNWYWRTATGTSTMVPSMPWRFISTCT